MGWEWVIRDGVEDPAGATAWYRPRLEAPLVMTYRARASSRARVSDLNCFWMARDPRNDEPPFAPRNRRSGRFTDYDSLLTYYVGYGGNGNTTTRFRRYDGTGARPLQPGHDLQDPRFPLRPDHDHRVALRVSADGETSFTFACCATEGRLLMSCVRLALVSFDTVALRRRPG